MESQQGSSVDLDLLAAGSFVNGFIDGWMDGWLGSWMVLWMGP